MAYCSDNDALAGLARLPAPLSGAAARAPGTPFRAAHAYAPDAPVLNSAGPDSEQRKTILKSDFCNSQCDLRTRSRFIRGPPATKCKSAEASASADNQQSPD